MRKSYFQFKNHYAAFYLLLAVCCIVLLGTVGYMFLEDISPLKALYLAIGTLTTISPFDLSESGRIFSIILLIIGFSLVAATAGYLGNMFLDGEWIELYRRRNVLKNLKTYSNHYIVCGYGEVGQRVVEELHRNQIPVVVIDNNEEVLLYCREMSIPHLDMDAMEEDALIEAGVERAKGLASMVNRDADNVYIVLSARSLNSELFICARASSKGVEGKLSRAGADRVVSPYASAAMRVTQYILRPSVTDFLEQVLSDKGIELELDELYIPPDSQLASQQKVDSQTLKNDFDLIVVAIMRSDGSWTYNPHPEEPIQAEETIIAVGPKTNIDSFFEYLYGVAR